MAGSVNDERFARSDEELARLNRRWREENREAAEEWNAYVAEHGLPLERYRAAAIGMIGSDLQGDISGL